MVRSVARSRGCGLCRQRRIKCDEKRPECGQCKRKNKACPGAITDTFFIVSLDNPARSTDFMHYTPSTKHPKTVSISGSSSSTSTPLNNDENVVTVSYESHCDVSRTQTDGTRARDKSVHIEHILPSTYCPSRGEIFDQLFFSHFFDTYGKTVETIRACSWLSHLPKLMATTYRSKAMKYASRATCMVWYGVITNDMSIRCAARNIYATALACQLVEVYGKRDNMTREVPSEEALCTSIMMAYFELVTRTTGPAWQQHMDAAASMIQALGPGGFHVGFVHQLYRTVRLGVAYMSVVQRRTYPLSSPDWMYVTPEHLKTSLDILVDILLHLSRYIQVKDDESTISPTQNGTGSEEDVAELLDLLERLDAFPFPALGTAHDPDTCQIHDQYDDDPLPGCLHAMKSASYIVLLRIIHQEFCESFDLCDHGEQINRHSAEVLAAVACINSRTKSAASKIFVTTLFPLDVVKAWSHSETDCSLAEAYSHDYSGQNYHLEQAQGR